ncbi:MAG: FKBP-type peptidyl-prolyl cis-trans isomerase, partial [Bacteroidota bacterium]
TACQSEDSKTARTSQGFEIIFHENNKGTTPKHEDYVTFNLLVKDGDRKLQSSYDRGQPEAIRINDLDNGTQQSKNWVQDALLQMSEGDSVTVLFPIDSLKGRPPGTSPDAKFFDCHIKLVKIFESETAYQDYAKGLLQVKREAAMKVQARLPEIADLVKNTLADYKAGKISNLQKTDSGLEYVIHEEGSGPQAVNNNTLKVQYYGALKSDGSMFDASFTRGDPITVLLGQGQVISGWDEGLSYLKEGSKATFFIPYTLAYGEAGRPPSIPEKADLVFYVELESVK